MKSCGRKMSAFTLNGKHTVKFRQITKTRNKKLVIVRSQSWLTPSTAIIYLLGRLGRSRTVCRKMIYGSITKVVAKKLTCPLSHPMKAVALYSMPDIFPLVLKLYKT